MHSEIVLVMVMSGVTILLRSLPFVLLRNRKTPKFIAYLGERESMFLVQNMVFQSLWPVYLWW